MKKILFLAVALFTMSANILAGGLTATLQQGDKMTPFYGENAFKDAYKAAQDGAVITLSAGSFNNIDESITKQITIIGNGRDVSNCTKFNSDSKVYEYDELDGKTYVSFYSLIIEADNVRLDGLRLNGICFKNISNLHISHCYIRETTASEPHKNTIIEQSFVDYDNALDKSENCCYKNSIIDNIGKLNRPNNQVLFQNCFIYCYYDYYCEEGDEIVHDRPNPYGIYRNCILGMRRYSYKWKTETSNLYWNGFSTEAYLSYGSEYGDNLFFLYPYMCLKNSSGFWYDSPLYEIWTVKASGYSYSSGVSWGKIYYSSIADVSYIYNESFAYSPIAILGDDGTVIGPIGGTGISKYSSIPHILDSSIDSDTDSNGKFNIRIKASSNL